MERYAVDAARGFTSAPRALIAHAGIVWLWPGIPLTRRCGARVEPIEMENARFWFTRFFGPEAIDKQIRLPLARAADHLSRDDNAAAQRALDSIGFDRFSADGAALMRKAAGHLGVAPLDLPSGSGPRCWDAQFIDVQLPLFGLFVETADLLMKIGSFDPLKHPRWGAGTPDSQGGRFQPVNAGGGPDEAPPLTVRVGQHPPPAPGIGHNQGPPLDAPPEIPPEEPPTARLRNAFTKIAAQWALRALGLGAPEAAAFLLALQVTTWLAKKVYPYVDAYLDPPKTLEELKNAVDISRQGTDVHHIVEKTDGRRGDIPESTIEGPNNLVRISTLKHWQITGWYMTTNKKFYGFSPRAYLSDKSAAERYRVGLDALREFGVLK